MSDGEAAGLGQVQGEFGWAGRDTEERRHWLDEMKVGRFLRLDQVEG